MHNVVSHTLIVKNVACNGNVPVPVSGFLVQLICHSVRNSFNVASFIVIGKTSTQEEMKQWVKALRAHVSTAFHKL